MEFWNNSKNIDQYQIEDPRIYQVEILAPDYTQEKGLTYSNLKKLRTEWQKVFPKLENLKYLYLSHNINQGYFEAICQIPNLKGLWIKTSRIKDFSSIGDLKNLEELNFVGSPAILNLQGIENLIQLKYCVLDSFFGIETVDELSKLKALRKLQLFGGLHGKRLNLTSIEPLAELRDLRELALDIKTNLDIQPLLKLKELRKLIIPDYYHSKISGELPKRTKLS